MIELTSSTNYFKDESEILEENKLSYLKSVIKKNIYEKLTLIIFIYLRICSLVS